MGELILLGAAIFLLVWIAHLVGRVERGISNLEKRVERIAALLEGMGLRARPRPGSSSTDPPEH